MKIAIIHDDFSICGGGEKLVSLLAEGLNKRGFQTDIFTFDIGNETKKIIPRGIKIITLNKEKISNPDDTIKRYLFSELKLSDKYDFFIFSGHSSLCAAKNNKPNFLYCHNIPESIGEKMNNTLIEGMWTNLYTLKNRFIKAKLPELIANKIDAVRFLLASSFQFKNFKFVFYKTTQAENLKYIQNIIVNSNQIRDKVKKYYRRESTVIYPPIETEKYINEKSDNYWVSINRVTPLKRIETQLKAFNKISGENLLIIGDIQNKEYYNKLKTIKPENVKFLGVLPNAELTDKLSKCKGMIFTAKDEDFGMSVVEAMAAGKPVIAPNEGGPKETIINAKTGILIDDINEDKLTQAIKALNIELKNNPAKYKNACLNQARKFDAAIFIDKIIHQIA